MLTPVRAVSIDAVNPQSGRLLPEFLVVCSDRSVFKPVAGAIRQVNGRLNCASRTPAALDYLLRRKIDGIIIDMNLDCALDFIRRVRAGAGNRNSVVFACMGVLPETQHAFSAGANFVIHRPLVSDRMAHMFTVARGMMTSEKRRFFRHPLMVPVELTVKGRQSECTLSNLSEGGMAIWSLQYYPPGTALDFTFALPFGAQIHGTGEIAWTSEDGLAGVKFNILSDRVYTYLSDWIMRRDFKLGI
jgi:hypothetical protein